MDERTVRRGEPVVIALPENPTTGYRWHVVGLPDDAQLSSRYELTSQGVGGGGERVFEIAFPSAGRHALTFQLRRPWERDNNAISHHAVQITVEGKGEHDDT